MVLYKLLNVFITLPRLRAAVHIEAEKDDSYCFLLSLLSVAAVASPQSSI